LISSSRELSRHRDRGRGDARQPTRRVPDRGQATEGHTLVVPRAHATDRTSSTSIFMSSRAGRATASCHRGSQRGHQTSSSPGPSGVVTLRDRSCSRLENASAKRPERSPALPRRTARARRRSSEQRSRRST
jgi:hypothetical protein